MFKYSTTGWCHWALWPSGTRFRLEPLTKAFDPPHLTSAHTQKKVQLAGTHLFFSLLIIWIHTEKGKTGIIRIFFFFLRGLFASFVKR